MKKLFLIAVSALLASNLITNARAVGTEKVDNDTFAEFSHGEFDNVSLTSEGHLELAPAITNLASVTDPIIWAAVQDAEGNVFFGTGNQGKIYKLNVKGELSTFFAPNEVMVHALAIDGKGRLYAATSPNGRVYRFDAGGRAEIFCTPGETYIWAMTFGKDGALYLATGNHGKILRVPASTNAAPATAETYFETGESHISTLAWDKDGNLLAGTSPHGYLYKIDKANHGFVVFNSGDTEIKQIAVAPDGTIFVSTFAGNPRQDSSSGPGGMAASIPSGGGDGNSDDSAVKTAAAAKAAPQDDDSPPSPEMMAALARASGQSGSSGGGTSPGGIYRIDTNGFHERYWTAPGESVYSMVLLKSGELLVGTGDKGRIYLVSSPAHWKLLQKTDDGAQVSALLPGAGPNQCFVATSHPAKLSRLDFALASGGTYTSKVFDAKQKSIWGKIHPDGETPDGAKLEFSTRSGNTDKPEKTWSDWSDTKPISAEIAVASPPARYLQYRAQFKRDAKSPSVTAQLRRVQFYFQNQNAAPVISRIKVYTDGFGVTRIQVPAQEGPASLDQLLNGGGNSAAEASAMMAKHPPLKMTKSPGLCTVVWDASDPNGDDLTYSVAIRSETEKEWTTLADKTGDTFFSFDTTGFHEGIYYVKVTASDELSNTSATARTAEETSEAFLIDNTPPVLTVKKQDVANNHARIVIDVTDKASVIASASYSIDGKDEVALQPDDLIFDSTNETFTIEASALTKGTHSLIFRAQDEAKNAAVLKLNFESQ